jgi:hypothetical protein
MLYDPSGKVDNGPLATDRPHTGKVFGYYRLPWLGQETWFGVSQAFYEGTPLSACLPVVGTSSACQFAEGRGNMPILSRDPSGNIVKTGVDHNSRTAPYLQTDFSLRHEIKVSKTHENYRLAFGGNITNLFNQHSAVAYYQFVIPGSELISPVRTTSNGTTTVAQQRFPGDPSVDWGKVLNGYNYIDALNGTGAFSGSYSCPTTKNPAQTCLVQTPSTLASRFGKPQVFQGARTVRLEARFIF